MKPDIIRNGRINNLFDRACRGKYQKDGNFSMDLLLEDCANIVSPTTAKEYANDVVDRLVKKGFLKR